MVTGAAMAVALVVVLLIAGRQSWSPSVTLLVCLDLIGQGFAQRRLRTRLQRAVELNTDQDDVSRENGSGGHISPGRGDS